MSRAARLILVLLAVGAAQAAPPAELRPELVDQAVAAILAAEDTEHGGLKATPGQPPIVECRLILTPLVRDRQPEALGFVRRGLDAMLGGALRDTVEGGFYLRCDDAAWTAPGGGKPAFAQASMLWLLTEAAIACDEPRYREAAVELGGFITTKLVDETSGLFLSLAGEPPGRPVDLVSSAAVIGALAHAGKLLEQPAWTALAARAGTKLLPLVTGDSPPLRRALAAGACLELLEATGETSWRDAARALLVPPPAGLAEPDPINAVVARVVLQLAMVLDNRELKNAALNALASHAAAPDKVPATHAAYGVALALAAEQPAPPRARDTSREVAVAVDAPERVAPGAEFSFGLRLDINEGWHVNAHEPLDRYLIGTEASVSLPEGFELLGIDYPAATILETPLGQQMAVYIDGSRITVRAKAPAAAGEHQARVRIRVQGCNDDSCLPPAMLQTTVPLIVR